MRELYEVQPGLQRGWRVLSADVFGGDRWIGDSLQKLVQTVLEREGGEIASGFSGPQRMHGVNRSNGHVSGIITKAMTAEVFQNIHGKKHSVKHNGIDVTVSFAGNHVWAHLSQHELYSRDNVENTVALVETCDFTYKTEFFVQAAAKGIGCWVLFRRSEDAVSAARAHEGKLVVRPPRDLTPELQSRVACPFLERPGNAEQARGRPHRADRFYVYIECLGLLGTQRETVCRILYDRLPFVHHIELRWIHSKRCYVAEIEVDQERCSMVMDQILGHTGNVMGHNFELVPWVLREQHRPGHCHNCGERGSYD